MMNALCLGEHPIPIAATAAPGFLPIVPHIPLQACRPFASCGAPHYYRYRDIDDNYVVCNCANLVIQFLNYFFLSNHNARLIVNTAKLMFPFVK